jgi:DNA-binding GntR family transcriptional regulator
VAKTSDIKSRLIADLARGAIGADERLRIDELSRRYGASHMPVRAVLQELHGAGLLRQGAGRSMQLVTLDRAAVENLFATRYAVECMLTRVAAQRITRHGVAELESIQQRLEHCVDGDDNEGVLAANREFHTRLYAVADNPEADAIIERHWLLLQLLWARVGFVAERYAGVVNDHRHLLRALSANDVEAAGVLMGAHVIKAKHELLGRLYGRPGADA